MIDNRRCLSALIGLLILSISPPLAAETASTDVTTPQTKHNIDLSKPENAIDLFVKAFRDGDDTLLSAVLTPHAEIPEFNPAQKIVCPSPQIAGFDIKRSRRVVGKDKLVGASQPGDIEAHVILEIDKKVVSDKCEVSLWGKGVYVLRRTSKGWQIVSIIPFWPEDVQMQR